MSGTSTPNRENRRSTDVGWRLRPVIGLDLVAWILALIAANSFYANSTFSGTALVLAGVAIVAQLGFGISTGLYRRHFRQFSFEETGAVAVSAGATGIAVIAVEFLIRNSARSGQIIVVAASLTVCLMFGHRYAREMRARRLASKAARHRIPVIIYGAGQGGERAILSMLSSRSSEYRPVALIDDDPAQRQRRSGGLRVEGTIEDLAAVADRHSATTVLIAMPSALTAELDAHHESIKSAGLETLIMPPVQQLVGSGSTRQFMSYTDASVLRRRIVDIDLAAVADLVNGARVLVTGAGGSIGSELFRQLSAFEPAALVAFDRDDALLQDVMGSVDPLHRANCTAVLGDVRDEDRLDEVFQLHKPNLVFHAAALQRVPALEGAAGEAWKTNVLGTLNVLNVCERRDVARFVNISTDKAVNPNNVLGYTKRIGERLTAAASARTGRTFVSVRFGNVIGSRGSVLDTFTRQIDEGGPITVTHREVTRHFVAVREAVRLTMQAAANGRQAEVLVLDMGDAMKVLDVAQQLIDQSGRDIRVEFTGLRPGEKLHEELLGAGETAERPFHPMIDHISVPPLELHTGLDACAAAGVAPNTSVGLKLMSQSSSEVDSSRPRGEVPLGFQ
jgi:FlaA1/EpsC-like NDP-sugar epimerase